MTDNILFQNKKLYRKNNPTPHNIKLTLNAERVLSPLKEKELLYAQADGSMVLTRKEGWKEVKLGRIFKSGDCIHAGLKQGWISNSQYVAHLGGCEDFTKVMDDLIDSFGPLGERLIFISDGAPWIKNWVQDAFPKAVSILDYYHACEHLHGFSSSFFKDEEAGKTWAGLQKELLMEGKVLDVISNIKLLAGCSQGAAELIAYYESNKDRMDYKRYRQLGAGIIGSGAIESAHRTVIQERMKLSGQRWSKGGAQNMLNLRVIQQKPSMG